MASDEFQDFSTVTPFERLVAAVEGHLRSWTATGVEQLIQHVRRRANTGDCESSRFDVVQAPISLKIAGRTKTHYLTLHLPRNIEHPPPHEMPLNKPSASVSSAPAETPDPPLRRSARHMARATMSSDATPDPARGMSMATSMSVSSDRRDGERSRPRAVTGDGETGGGAPWGPDHHWWPLRPLQGTLGEWEHPLHLWFGVEAFLTLGLETPYGEVTHTQDASTLMSAAGVALCACHLAWPAFIKVSDAAHQALWGVACVGNATVHFNTDSCKGLALPPRLATVEGQLALFGAQLAPHHPAAARACQMINSDTGIASLAMAAGDGSTSQPHADVFVALRRTWLLPLPPDPDPAYAGQTGWDVNCSWRPWAEQTDPLGNIELDVGWEAASAAMATHEDTFRFENANCWSLVALARQEPPPIAARGEERLYPASEEVRRPFQLANLDDPIGTYVPDYEHMPGQARDCSFSAMLAALLQGRDCADNATLGELMNADWWASQRPTVWPQPSAPPKSLLQDVLHEAHVYGSGIFAPGRHADLFPDEMEPHTYPHRAQQLVGAAPLNSLTARLVLNCLLAGNPRAVAALWHQFAKALWSGHWHGDADFPLDDDDEVEPLPRMPSQQELREADGSWRQPDLRTCLLHQKLHLLQVAIFLRNEKVQRGYKDAGSDLEPLSIDLPPSEAAQAGQQAGEDEEMLEAGQLLGGSSDGSDAGSPSTASAASATPDGVAGVVPGLCRENGRPLNQPQLQAMPLFTLDMLTGDPMMRGLGWEAMQVAVRGRRASKVVQSDMLAFKAANPGATFADFVAWHSAVFAPGPSAQMEAGIWRDMWQVSPPLPAHKQKPLLIADGLATLALDFMDNLETETLWQQLMPCAYAVAAALLSEAQAVTLPPVSAALNKFFGFMEDVLAEGGSQALTRGVVLKELRAMEVVVVAGESFMRRIPDCEPLASRLLNRAIRTWPWSPSAASPGASATSGSASGSGHGDSPTSDSPNDGVRRMSSDDSSSASGAEGVWGVDHVLVTDPGERGAIDELMKEGGAGDGGPSPRRDFAPDEADVEDAGPAGGNGWGEADRSDCLLICPGEWSLGEDCGVVRPPDHRMYVGMRRGKFRVATVLVADT